MPEAHPRHGCERAGVERRGVMARQKYVVRIGDQSPRAFSTLPAVARHLDTADTTSARGLVRILVNAEDGSERPLDEPEMERLNRAMAKLRPPAGRC